MANYEATKYDINGSNLQNVQGVSTGLIIPWGSASIPSGFLECDGTSYLTANYSALFAVIGYTYGGSGSTFNVPNLVDKTVVHRSNTKTIATTGGANTVAASGNISGSAGCTALTTPEIAAHTHSLQNFSGGAPGGNQPNGLGMTMTTGNAGSGGSHTHNLSANFSGSATSVLQPYLTLLYIIKT
jgi:microcystin-dependent protein